MMRKRIVITDVVDGVLKNIMYKNTTLQMPLQRATRISTQQDDDKGIQPPPPRCPFRPHQARKIYLR